MSELENTETVLDNVLENTECEQTILDDENSNSHERVTFDDTDKISPLNGDLNDITKQFGAMFNTPQMQNALTNTLSSLMTQLKPKTGMLSQEEIDQSEVSYDEIMNDVNTRIVPHLLSKVSGDGVSNIQNITLDKGSKSYTTIQMLYNSSKYLINKGTNEMQVLLYRDRIIGQLVWFQLYKFDNFYDEPTDETTKLMSETVKGFSASYMDSSINKLNLADMFKKMNSTNNEY